MKSFVPQLKIRQRGDALIRQPLRIDPIKGKGEGQIMLLHGPPGTGKTFTAECLAEYSGRLSIRIPSNEHANALLIGRPLLRLSCGELGKEIGVSLWE